jgi:cytochrome c553
MKNLKLIYVLALGVAVVCAGCHKEESVTQDLASKAGDAPKLSKQDASSLRQAFVQAKKDR